MPFFGLFGPPNIEKLKAKRDIQGLIKALDYEKDSSVQEAASEALGEVGDERAVGPLMVALSNLGETDIEEAAFSALTAVVTRIGAATTFPLSMALMDRNQKVREAATTMLVRVGRTTIEPPIEILEILLRHSDLDVQKAAAQALREIGDPRAVELLVGALKDADSNVRKAAVRALEQIGDARAVEPLVSALKDKERNVRMAAVVALGEIRDRRAVEPLMNTLRDRDSGVRLDAAEALGKIKDRRAVEPLVNTLKDQDFRVTMAAVVALGEIGDVQAVEPLIAALKDEHSSVRECAAKALGQLGDTRATRQLIAALNDSPAMRKIAAEALSHFMPPEEVQRLVQQGVEEVQRLVQQGRKEQQRAEKEEQIRLAHENAQKQEQNIKVLKTGSLESKNLAALELGRIGDSQAFGALVRCLDNKDIPANVIEAIQSILGRTARTLSLNDPRRVASLSNSVIAVSLRYCNYAAQEDSATIDCSRVRQLARQELIRRGEKA